MSMNYLKCLILLALLSFSLSDASAEDIIWRTGTNNPLTVDRITKETYLEVSYKLRANRPESKLTIDKIVSLEYGDTPDAYNQGLRFLDNYDYENAVNSFKLAMEVQGVRPWIKTYARFQIGNAFLAWGNKTPVKYQEAIKFFEELLSTDPMTRFYAEALLNLGLSHAGSGDLSSAVKTFDRLAKDAYDKKLGVIWEAMAKFKKAECLLEGDRLDEAERAFNTAGTFCTEQSTKTEVPAEVARLKEIAVLSKLSRGQVFIKKKKFSQAKDFFTEILGKKDSSLKAKAGAQNGLGECLLAEKKLKDAQVQFAMTKVLYGREESEVAKATYYLGVCCLELKDKEPSYKMRAQNYFQETIDLFPSTDWAKEARKKLK